LAITTWQAQPRDQADAYANSKLTDALAGDALAADCLRIMVYEIVKRMRLPRSLQESADSRHDVYLETLERLEANGGRRWRLYQSEIHSSGQGRFEGWVKTVAYRVALNRTARQIERAVHVPLPDVASPRHMPLADVVDLQRVQQLLRTIPARDRDALLRWASGVSWQEVATGLGFSSPDAVRMRIIRLLSRLREQLGSSPEG
jgi:DNA-directed RNA polymerase specialized sigma24 family protein